MDIHWEELTDAADSKAGGATAIAGATLAAALTGREAGPEECVGDVATAKYYSPIGVGPRGGGACSIRELDNAAGVSLLPMHTWFQFQFQFQFQFEHNRISAGFACI